MKQLIFLSFLGSFLMMTSFAKKPIKTQEELSAEYIQSKLEVIRKEEWLKCKQNTINDAEVYVDSIIYRSVNFNIGDTIKTPGKPIKPSKPFDVLKLDSTPIVPILKDTVSPHQG